MLELFLMIALILGWVMVLSMLDLRYLPTASCLQ